MTAARARWRAWVIRPDRLGDPVRRDAARADRDPGARSRRGAGAGDGRGRELQRRVGVARACRFRSSATPATTSTSPAPTPRAIVERVGPGRHALEARRRGRHPLQPELRRVPRVQRPRSRWPARSRRSGRTSRTGAASPSTAWCRPSSCLHKPARLTWEEAASYGLTYFTAYRMLVDRAEHARPATTCSIWGAGGGLGTFAVQLCALLRRQRHRRRLVRRQDRARAASWAPQPSSTGATSR